MSGNSLLVGRDPEKILTTVDRLLGDRTALAAMSRPAWPFGRGRASACIAATIEKWLAASAHCVAEPFVETAASAF